MEECDKFLSFRIHESLESRSCAELLLCVGRPSVKCNVNPGSEETRLGFSKLGTNRFLAGVASLSVISFFYDKDKVETLNVGVF